MNTLHCLGGTNRRHYHSDGMTWCEAFVRDEHGDAVEPRQFERFLLDEHPVLRAYWRHESLTTPELVEAAYEQHKARMAYVSPDSPMGLFRRAAEERSSGSGSRRSTGLWRKRSCLC